MNIVLFSMPDVTPILIHQDALHIPNLGIASVGANIDERHSVRIADLIRKRRSVKRFIVRTLHRFEPQLVGLSAMTWQYDTCRKIIRLIKSTFPDTRIVLGGYHATLMYEEIASGPDAPLIDFIVRGEGEETFRRLANALEDGDGLDDIPSLSFKQDGEFRHNPKGEALDLATLKLPIRDRRRLTCGYHFNMYLMEALETSRGCTRACNFCSIRHMYGRSFRTYPIERVLADIDDIYYRRKIRWVFISDDNMVLNPNRVIELCDAIIGRAYRNLNFFVQADCRSMAKHPEMVRKMGEAGFRGVFLGMENVSGANLEIMQKGISVDFTREAVANCHSNGIAVVGGLIFGLPEDDHQSIIDNYQFLKDVGSDAAYCQIITPYPKTEIRKTLLEQGLVTNPDDYRWYDGTWANVRTRHLDQDTLQYHFWYYRQTVLGMWKPTRQTSGAGMLWALMWKIASPMVRLGIKFNTRRYGWRGRYERIMAKKRKINNFKDLAE